MIKDVLAAFAFAGGVEASLADLKKGHAVRKIDLKILLVASEENIADAKHRMQEFQDNKDTLDDLVIEVNEAEAK